MSQKYQVFFIAGSGSLYRYDSDAWESRKALIKAGKLLIEEKEEIYARDHVQIYTWFMLKAGERLVLDIRWADVENGWAMYVKGKLSRSRLRKQRYGVDVARECDQAGQPYTTSKYFSHVTAAHAQRRRRRSTTASKYRWEDWIVGFPRPLPTSTSRESLIGNFRSWAKARGIRERLATHMLNGVMMGTRVPLDEVAVSAPEPSPPPPETQPTPAQKLARFKQEVKNELVAEFEKALYETLYHNLGLALHQEMDERRAREVTDLVPVIRGLLVAEVKSVISDMLAAELRPVICELLVAEIKPMIRGIVRDELDAQRV